MLRKLSLIAALTAALAFPADALARRGFRGGGFHGGYRYHGGHGIHRGHGYRGYGYRGYGYGAGYCRVWTPAGWIWRC
jgi:hypothetical protein